MDNTKVEIKTLKIKMGKKEVEITVDEARKLHEVLAQLFGDKVVKEVHHDHYPWGGDYLWGVPCRPYYWNSDIDFHWDAVPPTTNQLYCNSNTNCLELNI